MALLRLFDPTTQFQTKSGALNVAGKLRVYVENTDDLANIYGDDGSRLPQPLILDSNGRARGLFVNSGRSYRLEAYDRNDSLLFTIRRLEPNASGTVILEEGKVSVEEGKPAGYLKDILVSESDMVSLVPSGNQLAVNFDLILPSDVVRDSAYTHIDAATEVPLMDGIASVGVSTKYAREDHVHPTDTSRASASHTHGNIANGGTLQRNDITIANGDKLVVTDASDSSKVARASIAFDGSTTTKALTPKGTFEAFAKSGDITTAIQALDVSSVGGDGKYISAISETDGKISATATSLATAPVSGSAVAITAGGVYTALAAKQDALTFDAAPTAGSTNPVTSEGIKSAIDTVNEKGITVKEISGEQVICFE